MKKPSNLKVLLTVCSLIICSSFLISSHAQAQLPMTAFSSVMYFVPPVPGTAPTAATGLPTALMPTAAPAYIGLGTPWGAFGFLNPVMPTFGGLGFMPGLAGLGFGGTLGTSATPGIPPTALGAPPTTTGLTGWFGKATISPTAAPVPGLMTPGLMTPGLMTLPLAPTGTAAIPAIPFGLMAAMPSFAGFAAIMPFVPPLPAAPVTPTALAVPLVPPTPIAVPLIAPTPVAAPVATAIVPPPVIPTVAAPVVAPSAV